MPPSQGYLQIFPALIMRDLQFRLRSRDEQGVLNGHLAREDEHFDGKTSLQPSDSGNFPEPDLGLAEAA